MGPPRTRRPGLVDYALRAGGHDNITVIIIPIAKSHEFG